MNHQLCDNPLIEEQMYQPVQALEITTEKAVQQSEEAAESSGGWHLRQKSATLLQGRAALICWTQGQLRIDRHEGLTPAEI